MFLNLELQVKQQAGEDVQAQVEKANSKAAREGPLYFKRILTTALLRSNFCSNLRLGTLCPEFDDSRDQIGP